MNKKNISTDEVMKILEPKTVKDLMTYWTWRVAKLRREIGSINMLSRDYDTYSHEYLSLKKIEVNMWRERNLLESLLKKIN